MYTKFAVGSICAFCSCHVTDLSEAEEILDSRNGAYYLCCSSLCAETLLCTVTYLEPLWDKADDALESKRLGEEIRKAYGYGSGYYYRLFGREEWDDEGDMEAWKDGSIFRD